MADVESVRIRDALDILWSSLATIITCTYTILHLNVPRQRQGRDPGWVGDMKWSPLWRSLKWSIITILFPEYILAASIVDWNAARKLLSRLHRSKPETKETWQLTHMLFACMGGFAVEIRSEPAVTAAPTAITSSLQRAHADTEKAEPHTSPPKILHLPAATLVDIVEQGILSAGIVPVDEILDRSKSTIFTKTLTLGQTIYFLVQFCVRWAKGLPTTPMEVGVVGFVVCAVCTYGFVLYKPKDVGLVITLASYENELPEDVRASAQSQRQDDRNDIQKPIASFTSAGLAWSIPFGVVIGAIHLGGWNLHYPTMVDAWLWRGSSLFLTAVGVALLILLCLGAPPTFNEDEAVGASDLVPLAYAVARAILLVEMFRSLFYLRPGAFASTWTDNVPHFG